MPALDGAPVEGTEAFVADADASPGDAQPISMGTTVYIGLAVTSHDDTVLGTAQFRNVTATP